MKRSIWMALGMCLVVLSACQEDFAVNDVYEICESITCGGHGQCVPTSAISAICVCEAGYHNAQDNPLVCEADVNPCEGVTCGGHGTCIASKDGAVCVCDSGFHPLSSDALVCEADVNPCEGVTCGGHGTCLLNSVQEPVCMCDVGYVLGEVLTCVASPVDHNGNYLQDAFETAVDQGVSCRASHGKGCSTGFCDSFMDYRCSTRCTDDSQCSGDDYMCRSDGRCAPKVFETVWDIPESDRTIQFPGGNGICQYTIDWGDGNTEDITGCQEALEHTYSAAGVYHIKVTGMIEGWACLNRCAALTEVLSFGPVGLGSHAFEGATKLRYIAPTDIPNANALTDMSYMFSVTGPFVADLNRWDTSLVTTMEHAFEFAGLIDGNRSYSTFNLSIVDWDTSRVTNMAYMFLKAQLFNQDIGRWDTSLVTTMEGMFSGAKSFNHALGSWNTSNVTTMRTMFKDAETFNSNVSGWDTSKVTTMRSMFSGAKKFNQPLGHWNMSSITDLSFMFNDAYRYDGEGMSTWRPGALTDISGMCLNATNFREPLTLWSVKTVQENLTYENAFKNTSLSLENFNKMRNTNEDWAAMDVVKLGLPEEWVLSSPEP